jgi:hypothetical protein
MPARRHRSRATGPRAIFDKQTGWIGLDKGIISSVIVAIEALRIIAIVAACKGIGTHPAALRGGILPKLCVLGT